MRDAELLSQTLTAACQELRAEMETLQAEKAQEQYYANLSTSQAAGPSYDPSCNTASASGYGQAVNPTLWEDSAWVPEGWMPGDGSNQYYGP